MFGKRSASEPALEKPPSGPAAKAADAPPRVAPGPAAPPAVLSQAAPAASKAPPAWTSDSRAESSTL